jgi:S1-C subfamily serine protease
MFRRWFIASSFFALLLSGCGGAKSSNEIAKLTKASVVLITAYAEQPEYGTGFFVEGEKGVCTVLTARHVVPVGSKVQLQTHDGKRPWKAVNIKRFPNQDLALVTFKPEGQDCSYKALTLGNSDKVTEGDSIYITGFPGGSSAPQFVHGTVSALTKLADGYGVSYPVITVAGMSGGPVLNTSGEVIAIHGRSEQELTDW